MKESTFVVFCNCLSIFALLFNYTPLCKILSISLWIKVKNLLKDDIQNFSVYIHPVTYQNNLNILLYFPCNWMSITLYWCGKTVWNDNLRFRVQMTHRCACALFLHFNLREFKEKCYFQKIIRACIKEGDNFRGQKFAREWRQETNKTHALPLNAYRNIHPVFIHQHTIKTFSRLTFLSTWITSNGVYF